jgi:hypothetical protein
MGRIGKSQVLLALALLPLLAADLAVAQEKDPPEEKKPALLNRKPLKPGSEDGELKKLLIGRHNEALAEMQALRQLMLAGGRQRGMLVDAGGRVVQSGLEVYDKPEDRIALLTDYLEFTKNTEEFFKELLEAGTGESTTYHQARYYRIDAEIQLLKAQRAKAAAEKPKDK